MAVCLIVTLPGIPLNFDTPSQSFGVQLSLTVILMWYSLTVLLTSILVPKSKLLPENAVRRSPIKNLIWADLEESRAGMLLGRNDPELVLSCVAVRSQLSLVRMTGGP